jgi:hypothetical protein
MVTTTTHPPEVTMTEAVEGEITDPSVAIAVAARLDVAAGSGVPSASVSRKIFATTETGGLLPRVLAVPEEATISGTRRETPVRLVDQVAIRCQPTGTPFPTPAGIRIETQ